MILIYKVIKKLHALTNHFLEYILNPFLLHLNAKSNGCSLYFGKKLRIKKGVHFQLGTGSSFKIGDNVTFMENCQVHLKEKSHLNIKSSVYIGPSCELFTRDKITIGKNTLLAQKCIIIDYNHVWSGDVGVVKKEFKAREINIGDGCWLGARAIVLSGVNMGNYSTVGAGCVLRKNLEKKSITY